MFAGLSSTACLDATVRGALELRYAVIVASDAHSAGPGNGWLTTQNSIWAALGATVLPSARIDLEHLCQSAPEERTIPDHD